MGFNILSIIDIGPFSIFPWQPEESGQQVELAIGTNSIGGSKARWHDGTCKSSQNTNAIIITGIIDIVASK